MEKILELQQFIDEQVKKLQMFQQYYLEMQTVDAIEFPSEKMKSEWEEEFKLFSI